MDLIQQLWIASTATTGQYSTALGASTAIGSFSSAFGYTVSKAYGSQTVGMFNDTSDHPDPNGPIATDRIFQIGNSTSYASPSNAITVLRNGSTGIGITNPLSLFHIGSDATAYSPANVLRVSNNDGEVLGIAGSSSFANLNFFLHGVANRKATIQVVNGGAQGGQLAFFTKPNNGGDVLEVIRIDHNGNVGIELYLPEQLLM